MQSVTCQHVADNHGLSDDSTCTTWMCVITLEATLLSMESAIDVYTHDMHNWPAALHKHLQHCMNYPAALHIHPAVLHKQSCISSQETQMTLQ